MFGNDDDRHKGDENPANNDGITASADAAASEPTDRPLPQTSSSVPAAPPVVNNDLLDIKQNALRQLTPLIGHLDQSPEEKFRTTMMMIQASDNQGLVKEAYDAAQAITDDKTKAQALLDIVNEINYFTQQK